jgi:hypothetical protein
LFPGTKTCPDRVPKSPTAKFTNDRSQISILR